MNMYIYKFCPKMLSLQAAHLVLEQSSCLYCMIKLFHMYAMSTSTNIFQQDIHVSSINQKQIIVSFRPQRVSKQIFAFCSEASCV